MNKRIRGLALAWIAAYVLTAAAAGAQETSSSSLLNGLNSILSDPQGWIQMTRDSTLIIGSSRGEVSFGRDCRMRLHKPGTLERMQQLTEGITHDLGEIMGHKKIRDPNAPSRLEQTIKAPEFDFRLRPNQMGFGGKTYSAATRPLDLWTDSCKITVYPNGRTKVRRINRGLIGFGEHKRSTSGAAVPAVPMPPIEVNTYRPMFLHGKREQPATRGHRAGRFAVTSQSSFRPMMKARSR